MTLVGTAPPVPAKARDVAAPTSANRARLASATAWTALGSVVGLIAGPVLAVVLVRSMSRRAFGDLAVAASAAGLLATFSTMGLGVAFVQTASREQAGRGHLGVVSTVRTAGHLAAVGTLGALALLTTTTLLFDHTASLHGAVAPLVVLWPLVLLAPASALATGVSKLLHRPAVLTAATTSATLLAAVGTLVLVIGTRSPGGPEIAAMRTAAATVGFLVLVVPLRRVVGRDSRAGDLGSAFVPGLPRRRLLAFGLPALLGTVFAAALAEIDTVLLGAFDGGRVVGRYAPAAAVAATVVSLPGMIGTFYFPLGAELAARQDHEELVRLYRWATRWSVTLFGPALALMITCPGGLLTTVFGPGFGAMGSPLRLLAIGAAVQLLTGFNGLTLDALGAPAALAARQAVSLVVTVVACLALIPCLGADGAALAVSSGFVTANVLCSGLLWHRFRIPVFDPRTSIVVGGLTLGVGASWATFSVVGSAALRVLITGVLTTGTSVVANLLVGDAEDRRLVFRHFDSVRKRRRTASSLLPPPSPQTRPTHA